MAIDTIRKPVINDRTNDGKIDVADLEEIIKELNATSGIKDTDTVKIGDKEYTLKDLRDAKKNNKVDDIIAAMKKAAQAAEPKDQQKKMTEDEFKTLSASILQKDREIAEKEKELEAAKAKKDENTKTELTKKIAELKKAQKEAIEKHQYQRDLRGADGFEESVYRKAGLDSSKYIKGTLPDAQATAAGGTPKMGKAQSLGQDNSGAAQQAKAQTSGNSGTLSNAKASTTCRWASSGSATASRTARSRIMTTRA